MMRSKFVHEAKLVLHMSEGISIGYQDNKIIVCTLSINDTMRIFEEGLLIHLQSSKTVKTPTSSVSNASPSIERINRKRRGRITDYGWIKQRGLRLRVVKVERPSSAEPSYVLRAVHGDQHVRLERHTQTGSDLEVQDIVVVQNYDVTAVLVERERNNAQWLLVIPHND